jgi:hypothetical protein
MHCILHRELTRALHRHAACTVCSCCVLCIVHCASAFPPKPADADQEGDIKGVVGKPRIDLLLIRLVLLVLIIVDLDVHHHKQEEDQDEPPFFVHCWLLSVLWLVYWGMCSRPMTHSRWNSLVLVNTTSQFSSLLSEIWYQPMTSS